MTNKKFIKSREAAELKSRLSDNFAVVKNPDYVYPEYEIYPLAPKLTSIKTLSAAVMDMDGTTTTTEELCIHSLEFMVRSMCGVTEAENGLRLDEKDYPNIIGNSTTKHVEYLVNKYGDQFSERSVVDSYIRSALWGLKFGKDKKRAEEVAAGLKSFNLGELALPSFIAGLGSDREKLSPDEKEVTAVVKKYSARIGNLSFNDRVKMGIDIYYRRYHEILEKIKAGNGPEVSSAVFGSPDKKMIEPMPGILFFLCLVKGLIRDRDEKVIKEFITEYSGDSNKNFNNLKKLAAGFSKNPVRTAIVTSSIFYEADIVMKEVFGILSEQINNYSFSPESKSIIEEKFSSYNNIYDTFITASDSSEIRLKPHRDLYSIALHGLNVPRERFGEVIGLEDSESGTIAIRAAGIGLCIAVPFAQTSGHDLGAASFVCPAGIPEILLKNNLFINDNL